MIGQRGDSTGAALAGWVSINEEVSFDAFGRCAGFPVQKSRSPGRARCCWGCRHGTERTHHRGVLTGPRALIATRCRINGVGPVVFAAPVTDEWLFQYCSGSHLNAYRRDHQGNQNVTTTMAFDHAAGRQRGCRTSVLPSRASARPGSLRRAVEPRGVGSSSAAGESVGR